MVLARRHAQLAGQPLRHRGGAFLPRALALLFSADDLDELFRVVVLALLVDDVHDDVERRGMLRHGTPVRPRVARHDHNLPLHGDAVAREGLGGHCREVVDRILHRDEHLGRPAARRHAAAHYHRVRAADARDERQPTSGDARRLHVDVRRRRLELHRARFARPRGQHAHLHASLLHRERGDRRLVPVHQLIDGPGWMDVLGVHVAVLENQIAFDGLDAGALEVRRPFVDDFGGVVVVKAPADGGIAVADDLHVAVERAGGIGGAPHVDRGLHFEVWMEQIERGGGGKQLHVGRRRQRRVRVALADHGATLDLHDLDARLGAAGHPAVDQRRQAFLQRVAARRLHLHGRGFARRGPAAALLRRGGLAGGQHGNDQEEGGRLGVIDRRIRKFKAKCRTGFSPSRPSHGRAEARPTLFDKAPAAPAAGGRAAPPGTAAGSHPESRTANNAG